MILRPLYYAGVGSRQAPESILALMRELAAYLASLGYILRTGKAVGSDTAFEEGCLSVDGPIELWLPWEGYKRHQGIGYYPTQEFFDIASTLHPVWNILPRYAKYLHARNVGQILGQNCQYPASFVLCWTPDGCEDESTRTKATGGTGTAISLASRNKIPIFNLARADALDRFFYYLKTHLHYPNKYNSFYDDSERPCLPLEMVYVFGSNLAGRHGKGAALEARNSYGAKYGQGIGLQGRSYGIPTKDENLEILSIHDIAPYVHEFVEFTKTSGRTFYLTSVGCGLAQYHPRDITPLFKGVEYCQLPESWLEYLI